MTNERRDNLICHAIIVVTSIMSYIAYIRENYMDLAYCILIMIHAVVFIITKRKAQKDIL